MSVPAVPNPERDRATIEELAAAKRDLSERIGRQIDYLLRAYADSDQPITPTEASERARAPVTWDPLEQGAEHVSWHSLANLTEHEPERARDVWGAVKSAARLELRTGLRAARAVERSHSSPFDRAQYLAILEALRESIRPHGGAEELLTQMMATALEQQLRWQMIATRRTDEESWHGDRDKRRVLEQMTAGERRRHEEDYGWLPPRQSDAEALEQAVMIADRYQRQFLRLLRTFRDMRRTIGAVIMTGGQLNVAERIQQVNVAPPED